MSKITSSNFKRKETVVLGLLYFEPFDELFDELFDEVFDELFETFETFETFEVEDDDDEDDEDEDEEDEDDEDEEDDEDDEDEEEDDGDEDEDDAFLFSSIKNTTAIITITITRIATRKTVDFLIEKCVCCISVDGCIFIFYYNNKKNLILHFCFVSFVFL